jgi:hypothetical protein
VTTRFCGSVKGGTAAYAIPSQSVLGLYHIATLAAGGRCGCWDAQRRSGRCKHVLALRIVARQFDLVPDERTTTRRYDKYDVLIEEPAA